MRLSVVCQAPKIETNATLFTIRLTGEGVRPEAISASDLAELLIAAEQSVVAIADRSNPGRAEGLVLGLSEIKHQSIAFAFSSNQPAVIESAYRELLAAAEQRLFRKLPARSLEALRTLTEFSRDHQGHTQFWNGTGTEPLLDLPTDYAVDVPSPEYQRGETVFYGTIERVGGIRPRVRLRISPDEVVYGDITADQSRILGGRMYSNTALRGVATWDANDGSVVYFRVEEILKYERTSVLKAFEELQQASAGFYDQVEDVDRYADRVGEGDSL